MTWRQWAPFWAGGWIFGYIAGKGDAAPLWVTITYPVVMAVGLGPWIAGRVSRRPSRGEHL